MSSDFYSCFHTHTYTPQNLWINIIKTFKNFTVDKTIPDDVCWEATACLILYMLNNITHYQCVIACWQQDKLIALNWEWKSFMHGSQTPSNIFFFFLNKSSSCQPRQSHTSLKLGLHSYKDIFLKHTSPVSITHCS